MSEKYPTIQLEIKDRGVPPTPHNWRVLLDGKDISGVVQRVIVDCSIDGVTTATLTYIANVEINGSAEVEEAQQ